MSFKSKIIKIAIKCTPDKLIVWVANIVLKGIGKLTDFSFDLEARKSFVQIQLLGESETIDVWIEGFAIINHEESYQLVIHQAKSNRLWLDNILARITGKAWKIPVIPQLKPHIALLAEVFNAENPEQKED